MCPESRYSRAPLNRCPPLPGFLVPLARRRVDQPEPPVLEQDRLDQPGRLSWRQRPGRRELDLRPEDDVVHALALLPAGLRGWVGNLPNDPTSPFPQVFLFVRHRRLRRRFRRLGRRLRLGPPGPTGAQQLLHGCHLPSASSAVSNPSRVSASATSRPRRSTVGPTTSSKRSVTS